jgi:hypothetical protein
MVELMLQGKKSYIDIASSVEDICPRHVFMKPK